MQWEALHYVVIGRDRLDELAADAAGGDARAQRLFKAMIEWDGAAARCINCKTAPLLWPEVFILVMKDDGQILGAGICERCADVEDESQLAELVRTHLRRTYPSMREVTPGSA